MADRVLGDGEMLAHDQVLEGGILPRKDLVERGANTAMFALDVDGGA
jgi:hypothetical protein